jgi:hypothetical protein
MTALADAKTKAPSPQEVRRFMVGMRAFFDYAVQVLSQVPNAPEPPPVWPGGRCPFGYCVAGGFLTVDPQEADVVRAVLGATPEDDMGPILRRLPGSSGWSTRNLRFLVMRIRKRAALYRAGEVVVSGHPLRHPSLRIAP